MISRHVRSVTTSLYQSVQWPTSSDHTLKHLHRKNILPGIHVSVDSTYQVNCHRNLALKNEYILILFFEVFAVIQYNIVLIFLLFEKEL